MTEPGPLAEELTRFFGAAQAWVQRSILDPATARVATGSPECCQCPLCQVVEAVRGERPELLERFAEVQSSVAQLLRSLTEPGVEPTTEAPEPRVHKIDLSGESGEEDLR